MKKTNSRILDDTLISSIRNYRNYRIVDLPTIIKLNDNDYIMITATDENKSCKVSLKTLKEYFNKK